MDCRIPTRLFVQPNSMRAFSHSLSFICYSHAWNPPRLALVTSGITYSVHFSISVTIGYFNIIQSLQSECWSSSQEMSPNDEGGPEYPHKSHRCCRPRMAHRWRSIPTDSLSAGPVLSISLSVYIKYVFE